MSIQSNTDDVHERTLSCTTDTRSNDVTSEWNEFRVLAFYRFVPVPFHPTSELPTIRAEIDRVLRQYQARGTVILATEGINGTICYPFRMTLDQNGCFGVDRADDVDPVLSFLKHRFLGIRTCISTMPHRNPFHRLKIRIKDEIVTMGCPDFIAQSATSTTAAASTTSTGESNKPDILFSPLQASNGQYISSPSEWNALLQDPSCLVIDTRNDYEVALGTFQHAVNPNTATFTEFPFWFDQYWDQLTSSSQSKKQETHQAAECTTQSLDDFDSNVAACRSSPTATSFLVTNLPPTKIAMYCTGGIRCEKASAYCRQKLAKHNVPIYHYEGGILRYLQSVTPEESMYDGECYVFDQRVAVHGSNLQPSTEYTSCYACRHPLTSRDRQRTEFKEGISCPFCFNRGISALNNNGTMGEQTSSLPESMPLNEETSVSGTQSADSANPERWTSEIRHRQRKTLQPCERYQERQKQIMLGHQRGVPHLHDPKERTVLLL
jgi:UPF0176 protein